MEKWEKALNQFLANWKYREEVIAAMVCGSYITGDASKRSDVDVHIILTDAVDWRERGNEYIDGILIEYFANPPKQIRKYFEEDYNDRSTMSMIQFITGKIIFDKNGMVKQLKEEAEVWKEKKYIEMDHSTREIKKYGLWDSFDNLMDCYENERNDFFLVYYYSLVHLFNEYCSLINIESIPNYQITSYLTQPQFLVKYIKESFPDNIFKELFLKAIECKSREDMIINFKNLLNHTFQMTGSFNIDGWKIRTSV